MEITDVKIRRTFESAPLKAVASVTFDGQFAVHDIKVISTESKLFIVMPSRKNPDGSYRDIAHPINSAFRSSLEREVLRAYENFDGETIL
ncbi:MAG: septation regulator SpoVG [Ruminococcaceae bacterium]|nr:septation regulator SpoVG [Oscillospiraceae bacterium]